MGRNLQKQNTIRKKRTWRVRKKLKSTCGKPRLCVSKTIKHIGVQLIDDEKGITIASFSTKSKEAKGQKKSKESARLVGQKIGAMAKEKNVEEIVFDRGRFKYHGLVAEVAEGARESGLKF